MSHSGPQNPKNSKKRFSFGSSLNAPQKPESKSVKEEAATTQFIKISKNSSIEELLKVLPKIGDYEFLEVELRAALKQVAEQNQKMVDVEYAQLEDASVKEIQGRTKALEACYNRALETMLGIPAAAKDSKIIKLCEEYHHYNEASKKREISNQNDEGLQHQCIISLLERGKKIVGQSDDKKIIQILEKLEKEAEALLGEKAKAYGVYAQKLDENIALSKQYGVSEAAASLSPKKGVSLKKQ